MNQNPFSDFINVDYQKLSDDLIKFGSIELTSLAFILSMIMALPLNTNQQNALGNFFQLIGQAIETVASFSELKQENNQPKVSLKDEIDKLKHQLNYILKNKPK